jgi:hypothetical protein
MIGRIAAMSLYARARLVAIISILAWCTFGLAIFEDFGGGWTIAAFVVFGVSATAGPLLFRCPECGTSLFADGKGVFAMRTPWPRRTCIQCKRKMTI